MWWSEIEEGIQQQYDAAWGAIDDEDIADPLADPLDPPDGDIDPGEEAGAPEDDDIPAAIPWHVPEGMPIPILDPEPPLVNGYHIQLPPLNPFQDGADAH